MKWIIVFYQIIVALPAGEIVFSGLELGNKFVKHVKLLKIVFKRLRHKSKQEYKISTKLRKKF